MYDFIPRRANQRLGHGGYFTGNQSIGFPVRTEIAMLVDGMNDVTVSDNSISSSRLYSWNLLPSNAALNTMGGVAQCSAAADLSAANQNKVLVSPTNSSSATGNQQQVASAVNTVVPSGAFKAGSPYVRCIDNPLLPEWLESPESPEARGLRGCVAPGPIGPDSCHLSPPPHTD
jgi:hypothetical protein